MRREWGVDHADLQKRSQMAPGSNEVILLLHQRAASNAVRLPSLGPGLVRATGRGRTVIDMSTDHNEMPGTSDEATAKLLLAWADRLTKGEQGWERPDALRQTLAALVTAQQRGHFDDIEQQLINALTARLKYRAGEPPVVGDRHDDWREGAYIAAKTALDAMSSEQPYLAGRVYTEAVTGPRTG